MRSTCEGDWTAYPQAELNEAWKIVLRNQFHDIIPGSSIAEVYEDCREEYAEAERLAMAAWLQSAGAAAGREKPGGGEGVTVLNGAGWTRSDLVRLESSEAGGRRVPRGANGVWLYVIDIPQFLPRDEYDRWMERYVDHIRSSRLQAGVTEILLPGEVEQRKRQQREAAGVVIPDETWRLLGETAAKLGVSIDV